MMIPDDWNLIVFQTGSSGIGAAGLFCFGRAVTFNGLPA
jgi:hypothetical protein